MTTEIRQVNNWQDFEEGAAIRDSSGKLYIVLERNDETKVVRLLTRAEHSKPVNEKIPCKIESYSPQNLCFSQDRLVLGCPSKFRFIGTDEEPFEQYDKTLRRYEQ